MLQSLSVKAQKGGLAARSEWEHAVSFVIMATLRTRGGDLPCDHEVDLACGGDLLRDRVVVHLRSSIRSLCDLAVDRA